MELFKYIVGERGYKDFSVFEKHLPTPQIDPTKESFNLFDNQLYKSWKELGNAPVIGKFLDLSSSSIEALDGLESVGYYLNLYNTPNLKSLGNLDHVGGKIIVELVSSTAKLVLNSKLADRIYYY